MNTTKGEIFLQKAHGGVVQDKSEALTDRRDSAQPYRRTDEIRLNHNRVQSEKSPGLTKEPLVPLTTQVPKSIKAEIERLAKAGDGKREMSVSSVAASFIERGVQGNIDMQYGAMLRPIIEHTVKKELQSFSNRVANIALKAFYAAEQSRILNIHSLQFNLALSDNLDQLPLIIADSQKQAWNNLKHHFGDDAPNI